MEINLLVVFFLLFFRSTFQLQHQSVPLKSPIERAALFQLRSSLGLRTKDWPIKFDPCLTWIGVLCQDGGVVAINISGFKRTRRGNQNPKFSVHSLASFTKLVSFNASGFSLPGSMPNWSGLHLRTLKFLDLRFCEIAGAIPSSIGNLSNLMELYLSDNNLNCTIPSSLSLLSHLSVLDISRNSLTGSIPSCLGSLVNISLLDISSNHLSGSIPQEFGNLSNLQSLNLSNNNLSASVPTQLGNLSRLITLDLSSNSLSGAIPSEFGNLRNLERIAIHNNSFIGDLSSGLWSLPDLTFLDASDNNLIGSLPNLTLNPNTTMAVFNLSHNTFYGVLTSVLKRVSSIDLSYNYLQGRVPNYLRDIASLDKNCFRSWQSQRTVKECSSFYYKKGLPFHNFGLPNATLPSPIHDHKVNPRKLILSAILTCFSLILLFVISVTLLIICSYKKRKTSLGPIPIDSCGFAYEKILAATDEFNKSNLVKTGHSGEIFKGVFENGVNVIVKRFDVRFGKNKCMVELDFFSKVSHHRLVPLLGHCLDKQKEKFIVYKYMAKGDLSSVLDMKKGSDDCSINSLDWITRLKIAIGAAECLSYLHHECSPPLVHRDVQASSILLDDKYEVRLGSLSETCIQEESSHQNRMTRTSEQGIPGLQTATCAYDVYCFGKVLLELVTGKIGISASNDSTARKELLDSILPYISIYDKELVTNIMDPNLIVDDDLLEEVWAVAVIAKSCVNPMPSRRPVMRFLLKALENPLKLVREPGRVREKACRCSWSARWRRSSADVAGGRERYLSSRRHSKDVEDEEVERLNDARVD